uniref:Large ribosomal subunit protein eL31 n=1 Tax=uncultured Methanosarcinales archaeon TaxID=183757 RepID=A0A7H1KP56_9EURY|nr:50S ribosomal protein L31e [uncultured Methanosarcinales archaeon]
MMEKEQIYTIPLRSVKRTPRWKRSKRAVKDVRAYLTRHMKTDSESVKLDRTINEAIWRRGSQKPPRRIRVRAVRFEDGVVEAELA